MTLHALAINGSPRRSGNTQVLIDTILDTLKESGIRTETVSLAGMTLSGCTACGGCQASRDRTCSIVDDPVNAILEKMLRADAIILGSPVYCAGITSGTKALLERVGYVSRWNGDFFQRKVGIGVVAAARAGGVAALDQLNHFLFVRQFIIPGSSYWALGYGREPGDVRGDSTALEAMRTLGRHAAWLLQAIHGSAATSTSHSHKDAAPVASPGTIS